VLVDITAEDLDYMEIKALGHRKILLKGVDDLRRNGKFTPGALGSPQKAPAEILRTTSNPNLGDNSDRLMMSTSMQLPGARKSPTEASQVKTTHWSNLEPISNNKVMYLWTVSRVTWTQHVPTLILRICMAYNVFFLTRSVIPVEEW